MVGDRRGDSDAQETITVQMSDGRRIALLTELTEEILDEALRDMYDDCGPSHWGSEGDGEG